MMGDPYKSTQVSYSFGSFTGQPAQTAPPSEAAKKAVFRYNGMDYDPEQIPWPVWTEMRAQHGTSPHWTFCRFPIRASGERTTQMFGIVHGPFGVYTCGHHVCEVGEDIILGVLTHLPSGVGIGLFLDLNEAVKAAEIALRLSGADWQQEPVTSAAYAVMKQAWQAAGFKEAGYHAHQYTRPGEWNSPPTVIWDDMTHVSEDTKRTKKVSLS